MVREEARWGVCLSIWRWCTLFGWGEFQLCLGRKNSEVMSVESLGVLGPCQRNLVLVLSVGRKVTPTDPHISPTRLRCSFRFSIAASRLRFSFVNSTTIDNIRSCWRRRMIE